MQRANYIIIIIYRYYHRPALKPIRIKTLAIHTSYTLLCRPFRLTEIETRTMLYIWRNNIKLYSLQW